ncbi:MAG: hypothetical protein C0501_13545 [Isosphaera sp.]|nr:hypothetical protein [Isosphaera sp.]
MRPRTSLALLLAAVAGLIALAAAYTRPRPGPPPVRLAVLVVFDQMRGDFPERWRPLFGPDGFARLQGGGVTFTRCYYPYGTTSTGPGHASMLTGAAPDRHGIVNNNWLEGGRVVYCAGSDRYETVPAPPAAPADTKDPKARPRDGGTPDRLLADTVADVLKARHPGAKVFGLSLKDRSAILPTGKRPDGAYWFTGRFVTSTYYAGRVHPWVEAFNASGAADRWAGQVWERVRPDVDYDAWAGPDDGPGEGRGVGAKGWAQGKTFPHPMSPAGKPGKEYYEALANSPFGNDLLLDLAKECVRAERLGADDTPDLLVVSFSSNDLIGHTWGPDSHEVLDVTLRSDALMADLLRFLDEHVGPDRYLVGVTADHGICPLVEARTAYRPAGVAAKRVEPAAVQKALEAHLAKAFGGPAGWVEGSVFPWVHLSPKAVAAAGRSRAEVAAEAAWFLRAHPDVGRAYTRADLASGTPPADRVEARVRKALWVPPSGREKDERCGDVYVVLKEWCLPSKALDTGTTHGAPWDYDAHVPLMFHGPGVGGGASDEPVTPQAAAAVFARWLGLPPPARAEYPVPAALGGR